MYDDCLMVTPYYNHQSSINWTMYPFQARYKETDALSVIQLLPQPHV